MSLVMTAREREEFLAEVHVGVVAVNRGGRAPLAVPIWYDYIPGGEVLLWIERGSVKERLFREAGRFSICAQVETLPYKYVTTEGPVVAMDEAPTEEQALGIARRYCTYPLRRPRAGWRTTSGRTRCSSGCARRSG